MTVIDGDWGRSGSRHKAGQRDAFTGMVEAIERGEVSAVYAYATDRLARDVEAASRLLNACERAQVPIVVKGQRASDASALRFG